MINPLIGASFGTSAIYSPGALRNLFNPAADVNAQYNVHRRGILLAFIDDMAASGSYSQEDVQRAREWVERTTPTPHGAA